MQEGDLRDNGEDKTAEVPPSGADKNSKEESNRLLKFQISAPQPASSSSCCHGAAGHGRCGCKKRGRVNKHRHGGKSHDCGRRTARSHSSSCRRRRHRSASPVVDKREMHRDQCTAQSLEVARPSASHRRQRHHHYRHQRRVRDGEFGDSGAQPPPPCSRSARRCCRSAAAGSDSCCLRASRRQASDREHHQCAEEGCEAGQLVQGDSSGRKTSGKKNKSRPGESGKTECNSGGVFSRYQPNYCSANGDRSSSSSSSEDEAGEEDGRGRHDRNSGSSTFIFTQTRQSSSQVRSRRKNRSDGRCGSPGFPKRCADGPVQSTVEKHVLELNFPPSPLMRSISNLLQLHCACNADNKDPVEDDGDDERGDGQEKDDDDDKGDHFVHRMKPGQTCELQGESQVVLVSLPEPHKLTVEHVIRKSTSLIDAGCASKQKRERAERDRKPRDMHDQKEVVRCEETLDVPRFRRKHSYVRHTRRRKGGNAGRGSPVISKAVVHRDSSPDSDSSDEDEPNEMTYSKEKGTDEVLVRPVVRSTRSGRGDRDGCVGTRQRELRVSIPKVGATGCVAEMDKKRPSGGRKTRRSSKASSADSDGEGHRSGCVEAGSGGGGEDNTLRIVFTDSRLNTELRCILQDSSDASRGDRHGRRHGSSRTALARRHVRPRGGARVASDDNIDADSPREQRCGCVLATEPRQRARHGAEASDIVSSSYYSSTHESSVALNEVAANAGGGCALCRTIHAMGGCANERPCRQPWHRNRNARR
ncbi:uncharacterized protein LOC144111464 isoform X2 [Amblyomma americanum]